jgi:uncharacterized membrane protein
MNMSYNRIAGHSHERLAALSDGIFGVGMTLLVLDLRLPVTAAIHGERDLWEGLVALLPQLVMYVMSFMTLGIFWVGQQTQLNHLTRSDRHLTWIHFAFLLAVTGMPFSTKLLAEFSGYRLALVLYWANMAALGGTLYWSWAYANHRRLVKAELPSDVTAVICRRIVIAQSLYGFGALLCVWGTRWSIAFIVLVQLNYVLAPGTWREPRPESL